MNTTTLQDFWATRPLRRRREGKVAGVCAGLGARYDVDPTLIRIAFVVATLFGGSGILLYIVAALVMPSARDGSKADSSLSTGKLIVLGVIAVILVTSFGRDAMWSSGGLLGAVLMGIGCWLLYQRTPVPPPGTAVSQPDAIAEPIPPTPVYVPTPDTPATPGATSSTAPPTATPSMVPPGATNSMAPPAANPSMVEPAANEVSDGVETTPYTVGDATPQTTQPHPPNDDDQLDPLLARPTPPSWDPLGVADFAWDLPNPTPAPVTVKPKPPRSAVLPVTAGLAVLTAMAGTAAQVLGAEWFTVGRIASLTLLVIGVGLVVAGFQRKPEGGHASGLVPLGVLVGAIALVATMIASTGWSAPKGGIGERKYEITEQSQLREHYQLSVGNTILDLRGLGSLDADKTITVEQGVGQVQVLLPPNVRVRPDCSAGIGDVTCPVGVVGGSGDAPVLTIDAHVGIGNVEMKK